MDMEGYSKSDLRSVDDSLLFPSKKSNQIICADGTMTYKEYLAHEAKLSANARIIREGR